MSIVSVDNIQPIGSGTTVTVNKSVTLESGNTNITGVCTATSFSGSGANLTSLPSQVTISSNADNRIITGGSGTNLVGESTLTYDGSTLTVKGASNTTQAVFSGTGGSGSRGLEIVTESVGAADEGVILNARASGTTGKIKMQTNDVTAMTIDGSASNGNVTLNTGNLIIGTAGKGIDFSAQTAASSGSVVSEVMNHFSTGTIGVTLKAGSNTVPLYNNTMRYTRIGNICFVSIWIRVNGSTVGSSYSSSDTLKITGFPFAPAGNNDGRTRMRFNGYAFTGVSNKTWGWLVIGDGAVTIEQELHWGHPDFSTITAPNGTNIHNSSSEIYINGHYFV